MSHPRRGTLAVVVLLMLVACGSGGDGTDGGTAAITSDAPTSGTATTASTTLPTAAATAAAATSPATGGTTTGGTTTARTTTARTTTARTTTVTTRVTPTLVFADRTVRFGRPFQVRLAARAVPASSVTYRLVDGAGSNDQQCRVVGDRLTIGDPPSLPVTCAVEATARPRDGAPAPPARIARFTVPRASFRVELAPLPTVDWSEQSADHVVAITITERSGGAYYVALESSDDRCAASKVTPTEPPPGTTRYAAGITLADPGAEPYTCTLHAYAGPLDVNDGPAVDVPLTVVP